MKTDKDALVILGAGIMQIPAINAALEKNFTVIVFDGNNEASGKHLPHYFEVIDLKDKEKILAKCVFHNKKFNIRGVFTAGTDFSFVAAWLAEKLDLPGISYETALKATDKTLMRKAFKENNIPSPEYCSADCLNIDNEKIEKIGFPLVVKPVDSMGARGTVKVESLEELKEAVDNALGFSRTGKAIIEQYIEGPEFSLDALISDSEIYVCGVADRHIFFPPYFIEMGHTMPSCQSEEILNNVIDVFKKGIKAIGITEGAAKGDIKYNSERAVVGEIAARLSGGYMSGWTFPYSSGFSVISPAIDIAAGIKLQDLSYSYKKTSAERAFISIPGTVSHVEIPRYILEKKGSVKDYFINIKPGDMVDFPKNNVEKCGNIITADKNREKAINDAEKACRDIIIKLVPENSATFNFLYKDKENWIPDAFKIADKDNMDALYSMKLYYNDLTEKDAEKILNSEFNVMHLPDIKKEHSLDWQGRTLSDAISRISGNIRITHDKNSFTIGKAFWLSVIKGSVQGGIWYLETVRQMLLKGKNILDFPW